MGRTKLMATFLPNDYPNSVGDNYLKFIAVSNIGAISFSAMSFIGTQSLFVAIGRYLNVIYFGIKLKYADYLKLWIYLESFFNLIESKVFDYFLI